ncbi:hypothetical protein CK203_079170 [Vitis vinifera]|uniref:DUF4283 domain-containing protein n=1 Tax=Vitis vinifera TaxID=29760 RepID=A0A438DYW7_VITVI|nr:hypothetical protein CK203_079170 [Vitis vinifera]
MQLKPEALNALKLPVKVKAGFLGSVKLKEGKRQFRIVEKKRGVLTWVRLGLESLGLFKEGLIHCIRDDKEGRWEKEWKEGGKLYTLARGFNRAGVFLRLGVVDLERKRFCIFLPRGRRDKRGWTAMAEMVRQMEELAGRRTEVQEVTREEIAGNLQKLEHCLVASWKSDKEEEDDLESEAHCVVSSGSRLMGGAHLGLELWNPKTGCRVEEEMEQIAWIWMSAQGRWGDSMARILVKPKGDFRPSLLEIEVEDEIYAVALWWEIRPVVRWLFSATENRRKKEVRGDSHSRAEKRVGKELVGAGNEELQMPLMGELCRRMGPGPAPGIQIHGQETRDWVSPIGRMAGSAASGPNMGLNGLEKDGSFDELVLEESRREQRDVGLSMTDRAMEEEVKRYALISHPKGKRAVGTPLLLFSNSDRAPGGESFDRPGGMEEELRGDMSTWLTVYEGNVENENGSWKLGEDNKNRDKARGKEENNEGLEKEILSFLIKIRKRREKIHSKELLEKSKFERELKRLECSVNYEGGNKQKGNQDSGDVGGYCEKFGIGEILDWRALNAEGAAGGILICWDKRVLEILDWRGGQGRVCWEELGAIRGLWMIPGVSVGILISLCFNTKGAAKEESAQPCGDLHRLWMI